MKFLNKVGLKNPLMRKLADGKDEALTDVCPFTVFGFPFTKVLQIKTES